jgi:hypothetical protein
MHASKALRPSPYKQKVYRFLGPFLRILIPWNPDPGILVNRIVIPDPALDPDSDNQKLKIYTKKKKY